MTKIDLYHLSHYSVVKAECHLYKEKTISFLLKQWGSLVEGQLGHAKLRAISQRSTSVKVWQGKWKQDSEETTYEAVPQDLSHIPEYTLGRVNKGNGS